MKIAPRYLNARQTVVYLGMVDDTDEDRERAATCGLRPVSASPPTPDRSGSVRGACPAVRPLRIGRDDGEESPGARAPKQQQRVGCACAVCSRLTLIGMASCR